MRYYKPFERPNNDEFIQEQAFISAKLDINSLTFGEVDEIETEVSRRWNPRTWNTN